MGGGDVIKECINSLATLTGYLCWILTAIAVIFSLIINKISDKGREKREHGREQQYADTDSVSCRPTVHIVRSGGGPH